MVERERRRRSKPDEKRYQEKQVRHFFNGDHIVFDFFFFNRFVFFIVASRPPSSAKEQGLDQDPQEEGVAIEAQKKASQRRPHLFFLFVRLQVLFFNRFVFFIVATAVFAERTWTRSRSTRRESRDRSAEEGIATAATPLLHLRPITGDPADSIYLEVELRRLSFLKEAFAEGSLGNEFSPSSSMRALHREREMLCRQMQKKFPEKEREVLYRK
ncbi:hypothetical protein Syun_017362 [Stephania yunnanensis]|uniref:NPK1-activating kinesin-like protein C-terminal domain-containing protein n=1 Tax=Stephania yunnanensis TaxID=152371 RepID=A0AAP0J8E1_9MAGN